MEAVAGEKSPLQLVNKKRCSKRKRRNMCVSFFSILNVALTLLTHCGTVWVAVDICGEINNCNASSRCHSS